MCAVINMEHLKDGRILKFKSDTLMVVRKDVNLDKLGRIEEAINLLEEWIKMQPHFVEKSFPQEFLERLLITTKGLVERAKDKLDKLCTSKTMIPEYFNICNVKEEFSPLNKFILTANLPNLTPEHYRIYLNKVVTDVNLEASIVSLHFKYLIMLCEYLRKVDYCKGYILVVDYTDVNILQIAAKLNLMEIRQILNLLTEGYGLRIKGVHIISKSKMVDAMWSLLKQVFSPKIVTRLHIHKSLDSVYEFVPREIFPADYGGKEKSLKDLQDDWIEEFSTVEFMEYFQKMKEAKTDESHRDVYKFNESYIGMPGSFRSLNVD